MNKVRGLENWNLSSLPLDDQIAEVVVKVRYPPVSEEMIRLMPIERKALIAQIMARYAAEIAVSRLLCNCEIITCNNRSECVGGQIRVSDLVKLAELDAVQSISINTTNGQRKKRTNRKRLHLFCIKMTIAIQIEGETTGLQKFEQRYVLHCAYNEAEALIKAEVATPDYEKPYLNSDGLLVRWKVESLDDVYEVGSLDSLADLRKPQGMEVFSVLKNRKITPFKLKLTIGVRRFDSGSG